MLQLAESKHQTKAPSRSSANEVITDHDTNSKTSQSCQTLGTPLFTHKFDGIIEFQTISNGKCPLQGGGTDSSMLYHFDLNSRSMMIKYCGTVDVAASLDTAEWASLQSILKNLKSIAPSECNYIDSTNAEFFTTMKRDGKNLSEDHCYQNKI